MRLEPDLHRLAACSAEGFGVINTRTRLNHLRAAVCHGFQGTEGVAVLHEPVDHVRDDLERFVRVHADFRYIG
ncbi:hypothetical protein D3C86_2021780 [compost metagenome]